MSVDGIRNSLAQCSLGDNSGAYRKGDNDRKMSTYSVLGISLYGETDTPYALSTTLRDEHHPHVIGQQVENHDIPVRHGVSTGASVPIPIDNRSIHEDMGFTSLSECPSLSSSFSSAVSDAVPRTPSPTPVHMQSSEGLDDTTKDADQSFECFTLEALDNSQDWRNFEFFPWGEDVPCISAPRLSPVELPAE